MSGTDDELPSEFVERLRQIVAPEDWEGVWDSFAAIKPTYARINTLLTDVPGLLADPEIAALEPRTRPEAITSLRFAAERREALTHSHAVSEGRLYIQSLASQWAAPLLDPQPGETVLDLAAAPGGKTLHLAALMQNQGRLSAVERVRARMFRLADNLKRGGVSIARTYLMDGRQVGRKTPARFDRVLLDAPCSSEARLRRGQSEAAKYWSERKIKEQARKQIGLLRAAFEATKPGGTIVYCTCSFAPEENESIVNRLLSEQGSAVELVPVTVPAGQGRPGLVSWRDEVYAPQLAACCRVLPTSETDGFFLAKLRKCSEPDSAAAR